MSLREMHINETLSKLGEDKEWVEDFVEEVKQGLICSHVLHWVEELLDLQYKLVKEGKDIRLGDLAFLLIPYAIGGIDKCKLPSECSLKKVL